MYFTLFCLFILGASIILLAGKGGLWDNILTWVNCIFAGLIATNYFEPLANWMTKQFGSDYDWYTDFLAFVALFAVSVGILRLITDMISPVRVRFRKPMEIGGNIFFAFLAGWTVLMVTTFALHTAPMPLKAFDESFQPSPDTANFMGIGPDQIWLKFFAFGQSSSGALAIDEDHKFDDQGDYILRYGARRQQFEKLKGNIGKPE